MSEPEQRKPITINLTHHQLEALKVRWSDPEINFLGLMLGTLLAGLATAVFIIWSAA